MLSVQAGISLTLTLLLEAHATEKTLEKAGTLAELAV